MRSYVIVRDGVVVEQHQTKCPNVIAHLTEAGAICVDSVNPLPVCGSTYSGGFFTPPKTGELCSNSE